MSMTSKTDIRIDRLGEAVRVTYTDERTRKEDVMCFDSVDDLDSFIYTLRQASFDFKINQSAEKPRPPKIPRGC